MGMAAYRTLAAVLPLALALPAPVQTAPPADAAFGVSVIVASPCLIDPAAGPQPAACTPVSQQVQDATAQRKPAQDARAIGAEQSRLPSSSTGGTKTVLIRF
jgi:hypothetical protein